MLLLWSRVEKKESQWGSQPPPPSTYTTISWSIKIFFHVKSEKNINFLHVNNMWDFSLITEQEQIAFSEYVVLVVN